MGLFLILVNDFFLITNVSRTSALDVAGALDPPLLLKILFSRVMFLKVFVSEFALIIGLLWQYNFNTAYTLFFNGNLYMHFIISYNEISFKTCFYFQPKNRFFKRTPPLAASALNFTL